MNRDDYTLNIRGLCRKAFITVQKLQRDPLLASAG